MRVRVKILWYQDVGGKTTAGIVSSIKTLCTALGTFQFDIA